jgi:mRNA-degrading endonuclease toxin of MazEF toxin-antitoxin module
LNLKAAFSKAGIYPKIHTGEVWKAKDSSISLLGALRRQWHDERYCLVLSNEVMCSDPNWPLILIAPLSHVLYPKAMPDILVSCTDKNGLPKPSRIILSQIQPLCKIDLQERVGELEHSKWQEILKYVFWHIDRP